MDINNIITIDFETFWDVKYSLTSLSYTDYIHDPRFRIEGVSIKHNDQPAIFYPTEEAIRALEEIKWGGGETLLAHNTSFDAYILHTLGIKPSFMADTLGMSRALMPGLPSRGLKTLAAVLGVGIKDETILLKTKGLHYEDMSDEEQQAFGEYCANDSELCYAIGMKLLPMMPAGERVLMDHTLQTWTNPVIEVDTAKATKALRNIRAQNKELIAKSNYTKKQLGSNPQFAAILESKGIQVPTKISDRTGKEAPALARKDFEFQQLVADHPDLKPLFDARLAAASSIIESRLQRLIGTAKRTGGNFPVLLNYYGADQTGRYSGGNKMNPQNFSARGPGAIMRECLVAPDGYVFGICDSSQIEARVMAYIAGEDQLLDLFRRKECPYSAFGTKLYGFPVSKGNPDTVTERYVAKTCLLGLQYGTGHVKLRITLATGDPAVYKTVQEAQQAVNLYRTTYSKIPELWALGNQIIGDIKYGKQGAAHVISWDHNGIRLPNGMYIRYPLLDFQEDGWVYGAKQDKRLYGAKVKQHCTQALARIIVADQAMAIQERYPVVLQVHDENVALIPEHEAEEGAAFMLDVMRTPPTWAPDLPVDAEVKISKVYAK